MKNKEETLLELTLLYPWFWVFVGILAFVFYSAYKTDATPSSKEEGDDLITQGGTLEKELKRDEQEKLKEDKIIVEVEEEPLVGKSGG